VGRIARAIVDRVYDGGIAEARTFWQADDIDGITHVSLDGTAIVPGSLVDVAVERVVDDYDFEASLVRVVGERQQPKRARALPVIASSIGSYGK
jgi:hypothetical protein